MGDSAPLRRQLPQGPLPPPPLAQDTNEGKRGKQSHALPIRLEDLAIRSNVDSLLSNAELLSNFEKHERVLLDEKTGLYSYKVRSLPALSPTY